MEMIAERDTVWEDMINAMNQTHIRKHGPITQTAFEKVRKLQALFIERAKDKNPKPGDRVELTGYNNYHKKQAFYPKGGLDGDDDGERISVITDPYVPFVRESGGNLSFSTSGGYFVQVPKMQLEYVGVCTTKQFKVWRSTPCADGAIYFPAVVNIWRYMNYEKIY